jgi:hypothetical protein
MARSLPTLFATGLAAWMLIRCSTSSAPVMQDGGHTMTTAPDGPGAEAECGAINQTCCGTMGCHSGLTCNPYAAEIPTCIPCGAKGEPCCVSFESGLDTVSCTGAGLACQTVVSDSAGSTATCVPCGTVGSPCCAGTCTGGTACCDPIMNTCVGVDAECSNGSTCAGGSCAP